MLFRVVYPGLLAAGLLLLVGCAEQESEMQAEKSAPPVSNLAVSLRESDLSASAERVGKGSTQFTIVNDGQYPHGVVIRGNGFEQKIESVAPGSQTVVTIDLVPGTYELLCPLNDARGDHDQIGERLQVVVTE